MSNDLTLRVKKRYFDEMQAGTKKKEYRLYNEYWIKRIYMREFDKLIIIHGYPKKSELSARNMLVYPWNGYEIETITHSEFGDNPVDVFGIIAEKEPTIYDFVT